MSTVHFHSRAAFRCLILRTDGCPFFPLTSSKDSGAGCSTASMKNECRCFMPSPDSRHERILSQFADRREIPEIPARHESHLSNLETMSNDPEVDISFVKAIQNNHVPVLEAQDILDRVLLSNTNDAAARQRETLLSMVQCIDDVVSEIDV